MHPLTGRSAPKVTGREIHSVWNKHWLTQKWLVSLSPTQLLRTVYKSCELIPLRSTIYYRYSKKALSPMIARRVANSTLIIPMYFPITGEAFS